MIVCWLPITFVLCESRTGILVTLLFCCWLLVDVFRVAVLDQRSVSGKGVLVVVVVVSVFVLIGSSIGQRHVDEMWRETTRQLSGEKVSSRLVIMRDTVEMGEAKPWLGWGLATFSQVYPLFESPEMFIRRSDDEGRPFWQARYFEFAHCDWLQLWVETGVVGWILFVATPFWWWLHCRWQGKGNAVSQWLNFGCLMILLMACFEFPFGCEAVALLFACCLVLGGKYRLAEAEGRERL